MRIATEGTVGAPVAKPMVTAGVVEASRKAFTPSRLRSTKAQHENWAAT